MKTEEQITKEWEQDHRYYMVGMALYLRTMLIERFGEEWLDRYQTWIAAKNVWLNNSYVEACMVVDGRTFILRNHGHGSPIWHVSWHTRNGKWTIADIADKHLRRDLECCFER